MGESSAKQQDEARIRAVLNDWGKFPAGPPETLLRLITAAFAEVRRGQWIPVATPPENANTVMVWFHGAMTVGWFNDNVRAWCIEGRLHAKGVTHWMPLPEAPEPPDQPGADRTGET